MRFDFLAEAWEELEEAVNYYEGQRPGLGAEFAAVVAATIHRILTQLTTWARFAKHVRRCRTKRFPYGVLYEIRGEEIVIVAVMHMHRKPGYWKDRLRPG